jgi:hypothetical protein
MDCRSCLRNTAMNVARVCGEMNQTELRGIFVNLYSHPFCKSKIHLFQQAFPRTAASPATTAAA